MEQRAFGWRQLLGHVNLRDFIDMVRGELGMIASMLRQGVEAAPRLPFGPVVFLGFWLLALVRFVLLIVVFIVFGLAILVISAARGVMRLGRRG
jgi:prepilin signal peptidase PulO-like enzyme (type II secretory pathway)